MRRPVAAAVAAALVLLTASCGDDGDGGSADELAGVTVSGEFGKEPKVETTEDFKASSTESAEVVVGDGEELDKDHVVEAKIAVFDRDGKLIQGNYEGKQTEQLDLSQNQAPWLSELVGTHVGSRVAVALPVADVLGPQ